MLCLVLHWLPSISDIPFDGPTAATQVGLVDGELVYNPTSAQREVSDLALTVASTRDKVIMIEAGANEVDEATMIQAIYGAHELNGRIIEFFDKIVAECGKEKHEYEHFDIPEDMSNDVVVHTQRRYGKAVFTDVKQVRENMPRYQRPFGRALCRGA